MQSFKFFLTIALFLSLCVPTAHVRASEETRGKDKRPVAAAPYPEYIGYTWPYADKDMAKDIGTAPLVLEMFTAQGCIYCPPAYKFFNELQQKNPALIALACNVSYRDVERGSFSLLACTNRQKAYSQKIKNSAVFTPQFVMNGKTSGAGTKYDRIYEVMGLAAATPPAALGITHAQGERYDVKVPILNELDERDAVMTVIQYLKPIDKPIAAGVNQHIPMHFTRTVSSIRAITDWQHAKKTISIDIKPDEFAAGAVILVESTAGILAVADVTF